jgi:RNA-directed DNA polymerase
MIIGKMAADLGIKAAFIQTFARGASHAYKTYPIRKRGGGHRIIDHPSKQLKAMQRWLLEYVLPGLPVHTAAMAYQKGKSILDNAAIHADSRFLLRMDCKNFFPSITETDLRTYIADRGSLFAGWTPFDVDVVCMIVFKGSRLTIGAPTSPAVSNVLCFDMDSALSDLAVKRGVTYTRYADDLFFSANQPNILRPLQIEVERIVPKLKVPRGLAINAAKTRHSSKRRRRRVTGIVLGSDRQPHIGRQLKRKIRALIHQMDSLDMPSRARLAGLLAYSVGFDAGFMNSLIMKYGYDTLAKARKPIP